MILFLLLILLGHFFIPHNFLNQEYQSKLSKMGFFVNIYYYNIINPQNLKNNKTKTNNKITTKKKKKKMSLLI